jgi:hypothetical protein
MEKPQTYFFTIYRNKNKKYEWECAFKAGTFIEHEKIVLFRGPKVFDTVEEARISYKSITFIMKITLGEEITK